MRVEAIQKQEPLKKDTQRKIKGIDMEFCAECGKPIIFTAFMIRSNYQWTYNKKGKKRYCCGYTCLGKRKQIGIRTFIRH